MIEDCKKEVYDPIKGIGSIPEMVILVLDNKKSIRIPKIMCENSIIKEIIKCGSVKDYSAKYKLSAKDVSHSLIKARMAYDFEYWAATCVKIQDKLTKKSVPFIMRSAQKKLFSALLKLLYNKQPIRVILLKARQWGGSTLIQIFMAWIQIFHRKGWNSVIVADVEDQARNIKAMYSKLAASHPHEIEIIDFTSFEGSTKNKIIPSRGAVIYIGSMQKPDSLRSADVMMAHLSEVGLWKATEGKTPEDIVQSIAGSVPLVPFSVIIMESTAKGVGNYFHRQWQKAVSGENGYTPIFVAWWEIEIYKIPFADETEKILFEKSLTPQEKCYLQIGASLEGIHWYRSKKYSEGYDDWRMCCEFPSTPQEAFQSTGRRAHPSLYIDKMRQYCREPLYKGDLRATSYAGKDAIDSTLTFFEETKGPLWIWQLPEKSPAVKRRYIVSMDIGGKSDTADWSVISVIDRYWLMEGGVEESIATCRFHLDQDLAVWKAVQIAKFYCNAQLVVEANSLNNKGSEGDHTLTILDEIKHIYPNLYCRTDPQRIVEGAPERYGFFTSSASKTDLVNQMNKRFRELGYIERDRRALDEADYYECKENGSFGAVEGEHDDIYMSRAIALKASQLLDPPFKTK